MRTRFPFGVAVLGLVVASAAVWMRSVGNVDLYMAAG